MAKMNHIIFCVIGLSVILYGSAFNLPWNEDNFEDGEEEINRRSEGKKRTSTEFERNSWNVAVNLYKGANKSEVENVVFSPLSLTTAMVMLNSGAGGETAREIQTLFKFGTNSEFTIQNQTEILNSLTNQASGKETAVKLLTASRIYANSQKAQLRENFVRAVSSLGEVEALDFSDPKPAVAEINDWVNNQTQGKISKIVAEDNFSGDTAAVLLNFLYFKAPWKQEFDKSYTREADFHISEDKTVQVDMMSISAEFPYAELKEVEATAIFLPYKGDRFSMVIYLPWQRRNLSILEGKMETLVPSEIHNKAKTSKIFLYVPKFKITSTLDFKDILESLGVRKMFNSADFSGMSERPLYVSKIEQKVVIEVNEEGTEAAVVTDVDGLTPVSLPSVFKVDRPFIFQIYDSVTGAILFGGRISNPNPGQGEPNNNNQVRTTTTTAAPDVSTTVSPQAAFEDRIVDRIMAKLTATLGERDRILNFNMTRMQSQISRIEEAATCSPSGSPVATTRTPAVASLDCNVQTHSRLMQGLQDLGLSLQNQTENSQSHNETVASILELSIQFQANLERMGLKPATLANNSIQLAMARLARLDQFMGKLKREKGVENILKAFKNGQNDLVKSLLNNLTNDNQLDASMPEIIRGMFDGNINNYTKIIALFRSAKREQFKSGLTSLIDLFHNTSSSKTVRGNSNSNPNSISRSLLDEPEYLNLAYLVKTEFGTEFQSKFPTSVQNLFFAKKLCVRNLMTNFYLSVDKDEGLKDGGYSVSTRKKSSEFPLAVLCDWEIVPRDGGASFIIRQKSQAETLNLNVLEGSVFAGSDDYNPAYFWNIQLRKNAQLMTLQNSAASSEDPSYFLCSIRALNKTEGAVPRRGLELLESGGTSCKWATHPPQ